MTYKHNAGGFYCDRCSHPIALPTSSIEVVDERSKDLCDTCTEVVIDFIESHPVHHVVEPWSDDPDDLLVTLIDDDVVYEIRKAG